MSHWWGDTCVVPFKAVSHNNKKIKGKGACRTSEACLKPIRVTLWGADDLWVFSYQSWFLWWFNASKRARSSGCPLWLGHIIATLADWGAGSTPSPASRGRSLQTRPSLPRTGGRLCRKRLGGDAVVLPSLVSVTQPWSFVKTEITAKLEEKVQ